MDPKEAHRLTVLALTEAQKQLKSIARDLDEGLVVGLNEVDVGIAKGVYMHVASINEYYDLPTI